MTVIQKCMLWLLMWKNQVTAILKKAPTNSTNHKDTGRPPARLFNRVRRNSTIWVIYPVQVHGQIMGQILKKQKAAPDVLSSVNHVREDSADRRHEGDGRRRQIQPGDSATGG